MVNFPFKEKEIYAKNTNPNNIFYFVWVLFYYG